MAKMGNVPIKVPKMAGGGMSAIRKRPRPVATSVGKPPKGKLAY